MYSKNNKFDFSILKDISPKINIDYDSIIGHKLIPKTFKPTKETKDNYNQWKFDTFVPILGEEIYVKILKNDLYFNLCTYFFSFCGNEDLFLIGSKLNEYGFIVDDIGLKNSLGCTNLIKSFLDRKNDQYPLSKVFWNLVDQLSESTHPTTLDRFIKINYDWLKINSEQENFCESMTFDQYHEIRLIDAAADWMYSFLLVGTGQMISDEIYNSNEFKSIRYHFGACCFLTNDLFSFEKEKCFSDPSNYIKILIAQNLNDNCSLNSVNDNYVQIQVEKVIDLINFHYQELISSCDKALKLFNYDGTLQLHINKVKELVLNTFFIHSKSGRYNKLEK